MKNYFKYGNNGCIDLVQKRQIDSNNGYYSTAKKLIESIKTINNKNYLNWNIIYYGYDKRINRNVFMVVADISKKYKQQFMSYFIIENIELDRAFNNFKECTICNLYFERIDLKNSLIYKDLDGETTELSPLATALLVETAISTAKNIFRILLDKLPNGDKEL